MHSSSRRAAVVDNVLSSELLFCTTDAWDILRRFAIQIFLGRGFIEQTVKGLMKLGKAYASSVCSGVDKNNGCFSMGRIHRKVKRSIAYGRKSRWRKSALQPFPTRFVDQNGGYLPLLSAVFNLSLLDDVEDSRSRRMKPTEPVVAARCLHAWG